MRPKARSFVPALALCPMAAAQTPGDLYVTQAPGYFVPGPFERCDAGYEWWVGLRPNGSLVAGGSLPADPPPDGPFTAVDIGLNLVQWALLLRPDGTIAHWGPMFLNAPVHLVPPGAFAAVSAGTWHGLALRADGTLEQWGGTAAGTPPPGVFTAIAAGWDYSVALRPDGTIEAWGTNTSGVLAPPPGQYTAIAAGYNHALALRGDGQVVVWGAASAGDPPPGAFVQVSAGGYSVARRGDGTAVYWGQSVSPQPIAWTYSTLAIGSYFTAGVLSCYPNCDGSTLVPALNIADFTCFVQKFAAGEPYANCDNSSSAPVLNVADFTCFLQRFAAGCP